MHSPSATARPSRHRRTPRAAASRRPFVVRDPRKAEFEANKLRKRLRRLVGEAIGAYHLIEPHDRVMVCVSGGKDSYGLLDILLTLKGRAPFPFEVIAMNLDQKQPGFPADVLPRYLEARGVPVPHRRAGHLQRRQARHSRGRHALLAVLAAAARRDLPRRPPRSAPPRSRSDITGTTSWRRSS